MGFSSLSKVYLNFINVCEIFDKQFQCSLWIALAEGVCSYLENLQTCKQFADLFGLFLFFFQSHNTRKIHANHLLAPIIVIVGRILFFQLLLLSLSSLCFVSLLFDGTCFLKISAHQLFFMLLAMLIEAYCRLTYLKEEKNVLCLKEKLTIRTRAVRLRYVTNKWFDISKHFHKFVRGMCVCVFGIDDEREWERLSLWEKRHISAISRMIPLNIGVIIHFRFLLSLYHLFFFSLSVHLNYRFQSAQVNGLRRDARSSQKHLIFFFLFRSINGMLNF